MSVLTDPTPGTAERATPLDRARLRAAVIEAKRRYPGAVGDYLAAELRAWEDFGFRFGYGRIAALLDHLTT